MYQYFNSLKYIRVHQKKKFETNSKTSQQTVTLSCLYIYKENLISDVNLSRDIDSSKACVNVAVCLMQLQY